MYHWLLSMASFRFCETYLLHIQPFVVNKSAISPFLGGLLLRCLRKICGISAKEPYDDTQPPRPFSSIDVTVLKRRETSPTCVGFFCRKELYLCDVLLPTRALFVWGSFAEKTPICVGFFCRCDCFEKGRTYEEIRACGNHIMMRYLRKFSRFLRKRALWWHPTTVAVFLTRCEKKDAIVLKKGWAYEQTRGGGHMRKHKNSNLHIRKYERGEKEISSIVFSHVSCTHDKIWGAKIWNGHMKK